MSSTKVLIYNYNFTIKICRRSRDFHKKLLIARKKITEHETSERYKKMQEITEAASMARMILNKKVRQARASTPIQPSRSPTEDHSQPPLPINSQLVSSEGNVSTSSPSEKSAKKLTSGITELLI